MMDPAPQTPNIRALCGGVLSWVAFSVLAVAARGVRWEEAYEHALVITRAVPYPEGHPFYLYCRNIFSGQSYLAALVLAAVDSPVVINGARNVAQLAFCTVPVFLLGARFGGGAIAGHVSATLVLLGVHEGFQSYYPIESWPHFFGTGQIGTGYALLVIALLLWGRWRDAWLLLGLMPAVHIGQMPVVGLLAGLQWLAYLHRRDGARVRQAIAWFAAGLTPCIVFYFVLRQFHVDPPLDGAYFANGDVRAIWAAYTERHDLHRGVPRLNPFWKSWIAVALVLLLGGGAAWCARHDREGGRHVTWTLIFALLVGAALGSIRIAHEALGARTPFLLIGWMPYRLTNHLAILLVPLTVGLLLRAEDQRGGTFGAGRLLAAVLLLYALLLPLWRAALPEAIYTRYAGNVEGLLYVVCGGALAVIATSMQEGRARTGFAVMAAAGACALALAYPFALAAIIAGAAGWVVLRVATALFPLRGASWPAAITALTAMLLASMLAQQTLSREHLSRQPIHREVEAWLDEHGGRHAMILTPWWDVNWLAKIRRPIFADYQTAHLMSYMPSLAPPLKKMHEDVYGIVIDGDGTVNLDAWPARSAEEWRRLAHDYGFDYVLAPAEMSLQLDRVLAGHPYNLYRVAAPETP